MKWFVYLFSLYILLLSGLPCKADDDCCIEETVQTNTHGKEDTQPDHKPAAPCSPFFACSATHAVVVPQGYYDIVVIASPVAKQKAVYRSMALFHYSTIIWQPPKHLA